MIDACRLYETRRKINEFITIKIPTVGEILRDEDGYFGTVALFVATPFDMMVQLDDMNIDFTKISDWDLFRLLFGELKNRDLSLIFDDLDLNDFVFAKSELSGDLVLIDPETDRVIDKAVYDQIGKCLCSILQLQKNNKKPANEDARKYLLERARIKMKRNRKKPAESQIEKYIVALVNTAEFPYTYESVLGLTINQFYASLHQIMRKIKFDNLMIGCYAGTISIKELSQDELSWIPN